MINYYGVSNDGTHVVSTNLRDINDNPRVDHFFRRVRQDTHEKFYSYKYIPIDKDDNYAALKVGDFELTDIGPERGNSKISRSLTIFEHRTGKHHEITSTVPSIDFVKQEVLPLLQKLNELGSWESYEQSFEVEQLLRDNKSLTDEVNRLRKKIEESAK